MEASEIFENILKADEKLKYSTEANGEVRRQQAIDLLRQALADAESIHNEPLADQVKVRLMDLGESP
ncbi:MAG: hypothetical protein QOI60_923 [Actinomycetota bacterium]|jgi:hypothetical protein|nr:hypothetical protein [Actinomycetota bacterium]MEA2557015.1 hypothetical protein [Actinomycetota bacterium]MEA2581257.1 hypothetical protein [Actinomycetota bacterium]